jgi:hypothetical protein
MNFVKLFLEHRRKLSFIIFVPGMQGCAVLVTG